MYVCMYVFYYGLLSKNFYKWEKLYDKWENEIACENYEHISNSPETYNVKDDLTRC